MSEHTLEFSRRAFMGGAVALGAAACISLNPVTALAEPTAAEKQAEAAAALDSLNALQSQLDIASADYYTALDAQEQAQQKMDEAQSRIDEASGQISNLQDKLGSRARSMYRSGSLSVIDLLLGATSFQAFANNWDLLNSMNEDDATMVQQTKDLRAEVEAQKAEYSEQERIAAEQAESARQIKEEAEALVAEMQATYDNLSAEAAALVEQERAAREAAEAAAAAAAIQNSTNDSNPNDNAGTSNGGGTSNSGGMSNNGGTSNSGGTSSGGSSNNSKPQTVTGNVVVDRAYSQMGKPYIWGATGPDGFDCSGLVSYCLSGSYGVRLGTTYTFMGWTRVSNPQPGDICTSSSHCGIYIGGGQMIHAPQTGDVVRVGSVQGGMIYVRY